MQLLHTTKITNTLPCRENYLETLEEEAAENEGAQAIEKEAEREAVVPDHVQEGTEKE